jgi:hypothetical protein
MPNGSAGKEQTLKSGEDKSPAAGPLQRNREHEWHLTTALIVHILLLTSEKVSQHSKSNNVDGLSCGLETETIHIIPQAFTRGGRRRGDCREAYETPEEMREMQLRAQGLRLLYPATDSARASRWKPCPTLILAPSDSLQTSDFQKGKKRIVLTHLPHHTFGTVATTPAPATSAHGQHQHSIPDLPAEH